MSSRPIRLSSSNEKAGLRRGTVLTPWNEAGTTTTVGLFQISSFARVSRRLISFLLGPLDWVHTRVMELVMLSRLQGYTVVMKSLQRNLLANLIGRIARDQQYSSFPDSQLLIVNTDE